MNETHRSERDTLGALVDERAGQSAQLRAGIVGLALLDIGASGPPDPLARIACLAACAVPHADGAGLAIEGAEVASSQFVSELEDITHRIHEGPSVTAISDECAVCSGSLGGEQRWPHFGPRAGRLGVHSALSVPLVCEGTALGAIDVYAHDKDAFDADALAAAQAFAAVAAVSVANARLLAQTQRRAAQLEQALASHAVIERAVGIVIGRTGANADEALERLRSMSQKQHRKLTVLADTLVQAAARRARARRTGPS